MNNQQQRQEIERLIASPSENRLQLLSDALHSPITICSALGTLKLIGTPESLAVIQDFGLQSGFTAQETDQLLLSLSNKMFNRAAPKFYQRYDELPLALLALWSAIVNEQVLADFETWRAQQPHSLITVAHIDDMPQLLQLYRLVINIQGDMISLGTAGDAKEGGALVQRVRPDLIILDHMMPGLSGIEALDYIHNLVPASKIIFHSYRAGDPQLEREVLQHGAQYIMPYGALLADEVASIIRRTMGQPVS